jgi:hypothetical protein
MNYRIALWLIPVLALVLSACGGPVTPPPLTELRFFNGQADLVDALKKTGVTVEIRDPIRQDFFTPEGRLISVNGIEIQVFEYETPEAMEVEAARVASDGGSIGTTMVTWVEPPHFYKIGRIIILYVGSDKTIRGLIEQITGPQFAGR